MAAIVRRGSAKSAWLAGLAGEPALECGLVQVAISYTAAAVIACAVGAILIQVAAQIINFPAPIAVVPGWNEVAS